MNIFKLINWVLIVFFCTSLSISRSTAQQASGLYYENFAGIHGVIRNPAYGPHGHLGWDVNLGSINAYASNNYSYVSNSNLFHFLGQMDSLSLMTRDEQVTDPDAVGLAFYQNESAKRAIANVDIMGPSAWINFNPISVGLFTRMRAEGGANVPSQLGYYQYQELTVNELQNIGETHSAAAMWSEIGINLSTNQLWYDESFSIGVSIKYLRGHEGAYLANTGNLGFTKLDNDDFDLNETVTTIGYTAGVGNTDDLSLSNKGSGWAIDIGLSMQFERSRLGISILDIGKINFSNDAQMHRLVVNDLLSLNSEELTSEGTLTGIIDGINTELVASGADSTLVSDQFNIVTPMRLNINYDYQLTQDIFINSSLVQNLAMADNAIKAENNIAISPRYEKRWFTVATPVILSNYETIRVGFATRLGVLTIGTDNVLSLFGTNDFNGSSIYAAVKINPFGNGKKGGKVNCPKIKRSPWDSADPVKGARRMRSPGS